jgi:hypothetical protein
MRTMNRLLSAASIVLGSLVLSSCFPHDPRIDGPSPYGPYDRMQPPGNQDFGPYGNNPPQGDPYGNAGQRDPRQGIQDPNVPQPPVTPPPPQPAQYPVAQKTKNPNEVISPYPPYNVIDVSGFKSGQKAKDPSNKKIFVVP